MEFVAPTVEGEELDSGHHKLKLHLRLSPSTYTDHLNVGPANSRGKETLLWFMADAIGSHVAVLVLKW